MPLASLPPCRSTSFRLCRRRALDEAADADLGPGGHGRGGVGGGSGGEAGFGGVEGAMVGINSVHVALSSVSAIQVGDWMAGWLGALHSEGKGKGKGKARQHAIRS